MDNLFGLEEVFRYVPAQYDYPGKKELYKCMDT